VFGSGRRPTKTRSELFRDEVGKTIDHMRQAAMHGADGLGTAMAPRMEAARSMAKGTAASALAQLAAARQQGTQQVTDAARRASPMMRRQKKRAQEMADKKRGYRLTGLLAAGAAVGAVGALIARRRRQTSWEVYDTSVRPPQPPVQMSEPAAERGPSSQTSQQSEPSPGKGTRGVGPLAEQARNALKPTDGNAAPEAEALSPTAEPARNRRR
jgi:hypothetical protein